MVWVLIFGGIALAGVLMVLGYAFWLWHKATDLFSELEMLGTRAEELGALLDQIRPAEQRAAGEAARSGNTGAHLPATAGAPEQLAAQQVRTAGGPT